MSLVTKSKVCKQHKFSERLYSYLQENQIYCDVTFVVGLNKEKIKTSRLILVAASDVIRKFFEEKWDLILKDQDKDCRCIPLPDFEPEAFKLFLKLLPSESISIETVEEMTFSDKILSNLVRICDLFEMRELQGYLELLASQRNLEILEINGHHNWPTSPQFTNGIAEPILMKNGAIHTNYSDLWSTVSLFDYERIVSDPPFICDGKWNSLNGFNVNQKIELVGVGFLGPLDIEDEDGEAEYDVQVEPTRIINDYWESCAGIFRKRIRAKKGEIFHFLFDKRITVDAQQFKTHYKLDIKYSLKGPNTSSVWIGPEKYLDFTTVQDGVEFCCQWNNHQLVELLFIKL